MINLQRSPVCCGLLRCKVGSVFVGGGGRRRNKLAGCRSLRAPPWQPKQCVCGSRKMKFLFNVVQAHTLKREYLPFFDLVFNSVFAASDCATIASCKSGFLLSALVVWRADGRPQATSLDAAIKQQPGRQPGSYSESRTAPARVSM